MRPPNFRHGLAVAAAFLVLAAPHAEADEADAKALVKSMSDYLAAQQRIAFDYDATLEVVTTDDQKLGIASSGTVTLQRPDHLRATRTGGFSDVEMLFDGQSVTLLGKNAKVYTRVEAPGTIDQLVDRLRDEYGLPLPAADLLMSNPGDELMGEVTDVKDLGSGVIGGRECDHLAFRTADVDWQIWIAQGDAPFPCRYVITSKAMSQGPQYQLDVRDWRTDDKSPRMTSPSMPAVRPRSISTRSALRSATCLSTSLRERSNDPFISHRHRSPRPRRGRGHDRGRRLAGRSRRGERRFAGRGGRRPSPDPGQLCGRCAANRPPLRRRGLRLLT